MDNPPGGRWLFQYRPSPAGGEPTDGADVAGISTAFTRAAVAVLARGENELGFVW